MDRRYVPLACLALGGWWSSSCAPSGFSDRSRINTVRILASSADEPYAAPGDTVHLHVLAYDGRSADAQAAPMTIGWASLLCKDPLLDAYYACFTQFTPGVVVSAPIANVDGGAGATDAETGTGDGGPSAPASCSPSLDVTLPVPWDHAFTVPADIVTAHPPVAGTTPYGLAIAFNVACAGRIGYVAPDPSNANPQQAPVGCFDDAGNRLGPDDYVIGYTRVFVHQQPDGGYYLNANPHIAAVDAPPRTLAITGSAPALVAAQPLAVLCTRAQCPRVKIGPVVPSDSWEVNPLNLDSQGHPRHEEIWADYYATFGGFSATSRLLYEPSSGAIADPDSNFEPPLLGPQDPHDGVIFIVVHDDRGGAEWVTLPTHVCSDATDPVCQPGCPGF